jgi:hypothetical protein
VFIRVHPWLKFLAWATPNNERIGGSVSQVGAPAERDSTSGSSCGWLSRQAGNPGSKKAASIFRMEEAGRITDHTEKQGFWRFAQERGHTPREAPKLVFSMCPSSSLLPPC